MINCSGYGAYDTRAVTLNTGGANPRPEAGKPYHTITAGEIVQMVKNPETQNKDNAQWIIPSSYHASDARSHAAQYEHGLFNWLCADIDRGNHTLATVRGALNQMFPGIAHVVYSTRGSTETNKKWRAFIPLKEQLAGERYSSFQCAFFDFLEMLHIDCDRTLERVGQLIYLPNRGEWYEHAIGEGDALDAMQHPIAKVAQDRYDDDKEMRDNVSDTSAKEGPRSYVAAFRRKHTIEELLSLYGFLQSPMHPDLWRHPQQSSQGYGSIRIMRYSDGDRWVSRSETVNRMGVGRETKAGSRTGDAFDLYTHFNCAGNIAQAEAYARLCLAQEDDARYGQATAFHGHKVWDSVEFLVSSTGVITLGPAGHRAEAVEGVKRAENLARTINLDRKEGNNDDFTIDWPPGMVGELAQYIYKSSSRPIKQFAIATALYFFSVSGRKYIIRNYGLNIYYMIVADTGRGKGVAKASLDNVLGAIVEQAMDPKLIEPFLVEVAVSGAGINRGLQTINPMCMYEEELGATLLPLMTNNPSANAQGLKSAITELWSKSGRRRFKGQTIASSQENTKGSVERPSLTLAGDTQPSTFRKLLGNDSIGDGFIPRMITFYYTGKRAYHNKDSDNYQDPPEALVTRLTSFLQYVLRSGEETVDIEIEKEADDLFTAMDISTTDMINEPGMSDSNEIYNRAPINALKVAGLLAVGINSLKPVVTKDLMQYGISLIMQGLNHIDEIVKSGGGGSGETVRIHLLRKAIKHFVTLNPDTKSHTYRVPKAVVDRKDIISDRYFLIYLGGHSDFAGTATFTKEQNIRKAIEEALNQDIISELDPLASGIHLDKRTKQKMYQIGSGF